MAHVTNSPPVCQIPDCTTTQAEIESELAAFLAAFCSICKKERAGRLCGCAFPCSLTFRAHMLKRIHELLAIPLPPNCRAIQVCFKHPDLLKQAREACVARRNEAKKAKKKAVTAAEPVQAVPSTASSSSHRGNVLTTCQLPEKPKMCKIEFGSNICFDGDDGDSVEEFEDLDAFLNQATRKQQESTTTSVRIKFKIDAAASDSDADTANLSGMNTATPVAVEDEYESSCSDRDEPSGGLKGDRVVNLQYKDYYGKILGREVRRLMSSNFLNDVQLVCHDGHVMANSLLLASMSGFLRQTIAQIPIVDRVKVVIVPDASVLDVEALMRLLFTHDDDVISCKTIQRIKHVASLFSIDRLLCLLRKPGRPKGSKNRPKDEEKVKATGKKRKPDGQLATTAKRCHFRFNDDFDLLEELNDNENDSHEVMRTFCPSDEQIQDVIFEPRATISSSHQHQPIPQVNLASVTPESCLPKPQT